MDFLIQGSKQEVTKVILSIKRGKTLYPYTLNTPSDHLIITLENA